MRIVFSHERFILSVGASFIDATPVNDNKRTFEKFTLGKIETLEDADVIVNLKPDIIYVQNNTQKEIKEKLRRKLPKSAIVDIYPSRPDNYPGITLKKLQRLYDLRIKDKESG